MTCKVCGKEIGYGETYRVMENGDSVCIETECRMAYMLQNLTEEDKTQYFALCGVPVLEPYAKEVGLHNLPPFELELMLEWYESGCYEVVNEEDPDGADDMDSADFAYDDWRLEKALQRAS